MLLCKFSHTILLWVSCAVIASLPAVLGVVLLHFLPSIKCAGSLASATPLSALWCGHACEFLAMGIDFACFSSHLQQR